MESDALEISNAQIIPPTGLVTLKPSISISVREVVAFVLRTGDLAGGAGAGFRGSNRALEGTRGHQRLQKARPAGYEAEVPVCWRHEAEAFTFELRGRIDGVLAEGETLLIEEIKTVRRPWTGPADPLHAAQAKIYAHLYAREHGFAAATVRVTYLDLESGETVCCDEASGAGALEEFFGRVLGEYLEWMAALCAWRTLRDASIQGLGFPFGAYRAGQRSLAVAVYRAIKSRARLFAEAPTGIGKTVSVLFPAVKALGEGRVEKIFYATAKTPGRAVAEKTVAELRGAGLRLRSVTLTARDKICFNDGLPCDPAACPYALGYYDRIKEALRAALGSDSFTRGEIEAIARRHTVCPFELSLDLSEWSDLVICDYNYVFDPGVSLKRYFDDERRDYALLIDEAHNLADRAREMYSAGLRRSELAEVRKAIAEQLPSCAKAIRKVAARLASLGREEGWSQSEGVLVSKEAPSKLAPALEAFTGEAEGWLARNEPAGFRPLLLELYFRALAFQRVLGGFDARYGTILDPASGELRLFCVDPSAALQRICAQAGAAVFFSATLRPIDHFRQSLGGSPEDTSLQLASPFPEEHLGLLVQDEIATRLSAREGSCGAVAESIAALVRARAGNYLVYFPSYAYLEAVLARFREGCPAVRTEVQQSGMSEPERERFLGQFQAGLEETLVAFAVLGGVFGEGIDLAGDRLIGVVVVGVGLPQISTERALIRDYWSGQDRQGFDYAYTFPGLNRVLQAAGRVIRGEKDRGVVLLIDDRFGRAGYRALFPGWWTPRRVRSAVQIDAAARAFWGPGRNPGNSAG